MKTEFTLLFIANWVFIIYVINNALKKSLVPVQVRFKNLITVLSILGGWLLIQFLLTVYGFYNDLSLPPRIVLFIILPLFLSIYFFFRLYSRSKVITLIPLYIPIVYQSFRLLIELIFHDLYNQEILPQQVTYSGYNFDVFFGASAIFMTFYAGRTSASKKALLTWNILGILVVLNAAFTFITSFYFPEIWGSSLSNISEQFIQFPYLLLPAFFMPSAIFAHVFSINQLIKIK